METATEIVSETVQMTAFMETKREAGTIMAMAPMGINPAARMDLVLIGTGMEAARSSWSEKRYR
jgi:hypothetical protein